MAHARTKWSVKLGEFARAALPAVIGGLLWSYLAAAMLYGAVQA